MLDANRLITDGFYEFNCILREKDYNVRLYLDDALKHYYHVIVDQDDLETKLLEFLKCLILVLEFEVYHALFIVNETSLTSYNRLYNIQIEITEKDKRIPMRMVPEFTVVKFNQYNCTSESKSNR